MIHLREVNALECVITGTVALHEWRERHRLPVPGHEYAPRFKSGQWDGTWAPGRWCREVGDGTYEMRVSRGLVPRVIRDLGEDVSFDIVTTDEIEAFCAERKERMATLRDYQVQLLREVLQQGWGRGALATNAGKGAVIALLADFAAAHGKRVLIACDEVMVYDALLGQLRTWGDEGTEVAEVCSGVKEPPDALVTVAMIPTVAKRLRMATTKRKWEAWLASYDMLLLDEADKAESDSWKTVMLAAKNVTWRAGFSGSFPDELYDELHMETLLGPVLVSVKNKEMVERGISTPLEIEAHRYSVPSALALRRVPKYGLRGPEKRRRIYENVVVYNGQRHLYIRELVQPDVLTVIVVNRIDHGRELAQAIPGSVFLEGATKKKDRIKLLTQFKHREFMVLITTKILDRGTNRLGEAETIIFAASEGSATQVLQRIGRGLRKAEGKTLLRLIDILDHVQVTESTYAAETAAGYFYDAAKQRLQVYAQEQFAVRLVRDREALG